MCSSSWGCNTCQDKNQQNKVLKNIRKAKADFFIRVIDGARGNRKLIWKKINWKNNKRTQTLNNWNFNPRSWFVSKHFQQLYFYKFSWRTGPKLLSQCHGLYPYLRCHTTFQNKRNIRISCDKHHELSERLVSNRWKFLKSHSDVLVCPITHLYRLSKELFRAPGSLLLWHLFWNLATKQQWETADHQCFTCIVQGGWEKGGKATDHPPEHRPQPSASSASWISFQPLNRNSQLLHLLQFDSERSSDHSLTLTLSQIVL